MTEAEEAKIFIEKLSYELMRQGGFSYDKTQLKKHFEVNVEELGKVNPYLMSWFKDNHHAYVKKFVKLVKSHLEISRNLQSTLSERQQRVPQHPPYNLYESEKLKKKKIKKHYTDPCSIYSAFLYERIAQLEDTSSVLNLLQLCKKNLTSNEEKPFLWFQEVQKLCAITSGRKESLVLQLIMEIYNMKLTTEFEDGHLNDERLSVVKLSVEDFITFCLRKREDVKEFPRKPLFNDLLAAIISIYVDVTLLLSRNKSKSERIKEGERLCGMVSYVFQGHLHLVLDVLIQISSIQPPDSDILMPLCSKAFQKPNGNVDPAVYTKLVIASCQYMNLFSTLMSNVILEVKQIPAPTGYLEWLKSKDGSIIDFLPVKDCVKEDRLTKYLIEQNNSEMMNKLLDILTDRDDINQPSTDWTSLKECSNDTKHMEFQEICNSKAMDMDIIEGNDILEPSNNIFVFDRKPVNIETANVIVQSTDDSDVESTNALFCIDRGSGKVSRNLVLTKSRKSVDNEINLEKLVEKDRISISGNRNNEEDITKVKDIEFESTMEIDIDKDESAMVEPDSDKVLEDGVERVKDKVLPLLDKNPKGSQKRLILTEKLMPKEMMKVHCDNNKKVEITDSGKNSKADCRKIVEEVEEHVSLLEESDISSDVLLLEASDEEKNLKLTGKVLDDEKDNTSDCDDISNTKLKLESNNVAIQLTGRLRKEDGIAKLIDSKVVSQTSEQMAEKAHNSTKSSTDDKGIMQASCDVFENENKQKSDFFCLGASPESSANTGCKRKILDSEILMSKDPPTNIAQGAVKKTAEQSSIGNNFTPLSETQIPGTLTQSSNSNKNYSVCRKFPKRWNTNQEADKSSVNVAANKTENKNVYDFHSDTEKSPVLPFASAMKQKVSTKPKVLSPTIANQAISSFVESEAQRSIVPEVLTTWQGLEQYGGMNSDKMEEAIQKMPSFAEDLNVLVPATDAIEVAGDNTDCGMRRSVRLQRKHSNASGQCSPMVPSSPRVINRKRKASDSHGSAKKIKP